MARASGSTLQAPCRGALESTSVNVLRLQHGHRAGLTVHHRPVRTDLSRNGVAMRARVGLVRTDDGVNVADPAGGHEPIDGDQVSLGGESLNLVAPQAAFLLSPRPPWRPCRPGLRIKRCERPTRSPLQSAHPSSDSKRSRADTGTDADSASVVGPGAPCGGSGRRRWRG